MRRRRHAYPDADRQPDVHPGGTPGPWTAGNAYPLNDVRYGFAQTATHFYVFGGVADGSRVNNVNRMDLASGTWQPRAPMPFTSEAPTCALDGIHWHRLLRGGRHRQRLRQLQHCHRHLDLVGCRSLCYGSLRLCIGRLQREGVCRGWHHLLQ